MSKKSEPVISEKSTVLFVTFSRWENGVRTPTNGSLDPLRDYLLPRIKKFVIIDQPHPGSDRVMPVIEEYKSKKLKMHKSSLILYLLKPFLEKYNVSKTQPIFKIRDFISIIDWSIRDKSKFDYCICLESINTIAAILLRKLGRVKKVVYYVSDYSPSRYKSKWFNYLYLAMDRFCVSNADYIWDVSKAMQPARIEAGLKPSISYPVIHVPNGLYPNQIKTNNVGKIKKHSIVYMGTLTADNGPDIIIKALPLVLKKFKDVKLEIVGGTERDYVWLNKIVKKLNLARFVNFHGFIVDNSKMSEILRSCYVGVAPYRDVPGSIRRYADAGKIRAYCAAGLPVISSKVPPLGLEVEKLGGAIIVKDDPISFAHAIDNIFSDSKMYLRIRKNAILFAKDSTWDNTFTKAFLRMSELSQGKK